MIFSTASEGFPEAWKGFRVSCGLVEVHDMGFSRGLILQGFQILQHSTRKSTLELTQKT